MTDEFEHALRRALGDIEEQRPEPQGLSVGASVVQGKASRRHLRMTLGALGAVGAVVGSVAVGSGLMPATSVPRQAVVATPSPDGDLHGSAWRHLTGGGAAFPVESYRSLRDLVLSEPVIVEGTVVDVAVGREAPTNDAVTKYIRIEVAVEGENVPVTVEFGPFFPDELAQGLRTLRDPDSGVIGQHGLWFLRQKSDTPQTETIYRTATPGSVVLRDGSDVAVPPNVEPGEPLAAWDSRPWTDLLQQVSQIQEGR